MDLFTPVVPQRQLHANLLSIIRERDDSARAVLRAWADGFVDRDGKFLREFQTTFNSSFWELYLFACLKEQGLTVDLSHPRPDFVVTGPDAPFCIEATTANHACGAAAEWERDLGALARNEFALHAVVDAAALRLAAAVVAKHTHYCDGYAALAHVVGRPFVIAVAPFDQPFFFFQNTEAIAKVLYGHELAYVDVGERQTRYILGQRYVASVDKPNGAQVPVGFFADRRMAKISAVLFSSTATWGKVRALSDDPRPAFFEVLRYNRHGLTPRHELIPRTEYQESLLDGLHVFHNPYAASPLTRGVFDHPDVAHHWLDPASNVLMDNARDGGLIQRSVITIATRPAAESAPGRPA